MTVRLGPTRAAVVERRTGRARGAQRRCPLALSRALGERYFTVKVTESSAVTDPSLALAAYTLTV